MNGGWRTYRCDICHGMFGTDKNLDEQKERACHYCVRVPITMDRGDLHFAGNHHPSSMASDYQFHGDYYRG